MTRDTLEALAARVEAASGPDREMDRKIALLVGGFFLAEPRYAGAAQMYGYVDAEGCRVEPGNGAADRLVPAYTASLDAAVTLVPEDYDWAVFRTNGGITVHAWCGSGDDIFDIFAATPALALTAAALRARSATLSQDTDHD